MLGFWIHIHVLHNFKNEFLIMQPTVNQLFT